MHLNPHLNALLELQRAAPPASASLSDRKRFYAEQGARLSGYCRNLGPNGRSETLAALAEYRALARPRQFRFMDSVPVKIDSATVEALIAVEGYLEASYDEAANEPPANEAARSFKRPAFDGYGAAHPALLRSAVFTDRTHEERVFQVLGFKNTTIERVGEPLSLDDLQTLVYSISKVRDWNDQGTTLTINAWEAAAILGWAKNSQSVRRLLASYERMQMTRVRVKHDEATDTGESAPIVGKVTYSNDKRTHWTVQLTSTLLDAISERYPSFLKLATMAALPGGAPTWVYGFICSEANEVSTWDEDDLTAMAGLYSGKKDKRRKKLKDALDLMVTGVVEVKARGRAVHNEQRGELTETKGGWLVLRAKSSKLKTFEPVLVSYRFIKTAKGKNRVELHKVMPKKDVGRPEAQAR